MGSEENGLTIGRPTGEYVGARMVSETARDATGGGDDVDVGVAIVLAAEGYEGTIGREVGIEFVADAGSETTGLAASAGNGPEVAGVFEDDLRFRDGRVAEEECWGGC